MKKVPLHKLLSIGNLIICVVLALLVLLLVRDSLSLLAPPSGKSATVGDKKPAKKAESRNLSYYAPVLSNNVFGFPPSSLRALTGTRRGSRANGSLTLRGTVAFRNGSGYAIVEDAYRMQWVYGVGELIEGAGTLARVERDRIIVDYDGSEQEIKLADLVLVQEAPGEAQGPTPWSRKSRDHETSAPTDFVRKMAERSYMLDQDAVKAALEDPERILTDARLLPNVVDGEQEGFVISEIKEDGLYHSLGLRDGDVLKRVNDLTINDAQTALQAFTALRGMERIELDILRDGTNMTLTYVLR